MEVLNSVTSVITNMYKTKYSSIRKRLSDWKSKKTQLYNVYKKYTLNISLHFNQQVESKRMENVYMQTLIIQKLVYLY